MDDAAKPLVSIGVPVFNGAAGIGHALDSLLRQDYPNLEVIISDNGSTDRTAEICRRYALEHPRVSFHRSETNRGAVWNFNRVFELSSGEYFMWAAHDDERAPEFVSACVAKLEASPGAVLCQAHTAFFIEGNDALLCTATLDTFERVHDPIDRYHETLYRFPASAVYGVYRRSAMAKTRMFAPSIATDVAFILELSLHGDFVQVPRTLFTYFGRKKWNTIHQDYRLWVGGERKPWWYLPFVALFRNHWRRVAAARLSWPVRFRLWTFLVEHQLRQIALKVLIKTVRLGPDRLKVKAAPAIYWRWMHNPNVTVGDQPLYMERAIKPIVGLWR